MNIVMHAHTRTHTQHKYSCISSAHREHIDRKINYFKYPVLFFFPVTFDVCVCMLVCTGTITHRTCFPECQKLLNIIENENSKNGLTTYLALARPTSYTKRFFLFCNNFFCYYFVDARKKKRRIMLKPFGLPVKHYTGTYLYATTYMAYPPIKYVRAMT